MNRIALAADLEIDAVTFAPNLAYLRGADLVGSGLGLAESGIRITARGEQMLRDWRRHFGGS